MQALQIEFDLDPCGMVGRQLRWVRHTITPPEDGLTVEWKGCVWLNPPFNRYQRPEWMRRMAAHGDGVMLIPAACETLPFQQYVFGKASGILMLDHRPHFIDAQGNRAKANSGCTICLVAYGEENRKALMRSGLGTMLQEAA